MTTITGIRSLFQHTATRRWLGGVKWETIDGMDVSTHSHPKVAGLLNYAKVGA